MSGYTCLRGTSRVQIGMLVSMLLYIKVPAEDYSSIASETYFLCWVMHLVFSILHIASFTTFYIEAAMSLAAIF